uniref:Uncharacterized protein n=1 Tax=Steinernema glaseri TaxID=37863 RepID=A0A1I7ZN02_9BILA
MESSKPFSVKFVGSSRAYQSTAKRLRQTHGLLAVATRRRDKESLPKRDASLDGFTFDFDHTRRLQASRFMMINGRRRESTRNYDDRNAILVQIGEDGRREDIRRWKVPHIFDHTTVRAETTRSPLSNV